MNSKNCDQKSCLSARSYVFTVFLKYLTFLYFQDLSAADDCENEYISGGNRRYNQRTNQKLRRRSGNANVRGIILFLQKNLILFSHDIKLIRPSGIKHEKARLL